MKKLETLKSNDVYISAIVYLRFSAFIVFYVYSSGFSSFEWISNQITIFLFQ